VLWYKDSNEPREKEPEPDKNDELKMELEGLSGKLPIKPGVEAEKNRELLWTRAFSGVGEQGGGGAGRESERFISTR
jgi:hypothetical protein